MIAYSRPSPPPGFPPQRIRDAEASLRATGGAAECKGHWADYKSEFYRAQHGKCGWCEADNTTEPGAVDHYRPKAEVGCLTAIGRERPDSTGVSERRVEVVHSPGYWWLTYAWDNWLYVCNRCNSGWKLSLFPVAEVPHPRPDPATADTPLLLNPYEGDDPLDHLDFSDLGQIEPWNASLRGQATIATCGLDRESLRRARMRVAREARRWCDQVTDPMVAPALKRALCALRELGDDASPFAGTVRAVIRRELGLPWHEFQVVSI